MVLWIPRLCQLAAASASARSHWHNGRSARALQSKVLAARVLFLVTCAAIAGCNDYDEIAAWSPHPFPFLQRHAEYHFGEPKEDWLRVVQNRIDPVLFGACFLAWATALRPTYSCSMADPLPVRRHGIGQKPLHLVSACASTQRLVLTREAVDAKANEWTAMLATLARMEVAGALVTVDAIATIPSWPRRSPTATGLQGRRLPARLEAQPAKPARRGGGAVRRSRRRRPRDPRERRQGPRTHRNAHLNGTT